MFIHSVSDLVITKIISANRLQHSPVGITTQRRNRDCWAVALKSEGETVYHAKGKNIVSDCFHPVILPKGADYSWKCVKPGDCLIIEFEADAREGSVASLEISDNSIIVNSFLKIEKNLNRQKPHDMLACYKLLYEILAFLVKSAAKDYVDSEKQKILKPAFQYILENYYDSSITNEYLSDLCGISTVYFRKTFENVYGISPIKYLHNFRIKKAKALLSSDYGTIEQVAFSVGYSSIYHFSKMFKLYVGKTPTEYAKTT